MIRRFLLVAVFLAIASVNVFAQTDIDAAFDLMRHGDIQGSFEKFKASAMKANVYAQFCLAVCYEKGYGTEKNASEAFRYYRKTAEKGLAVGQRALADCYKKGIGTGVDNDKYGYWLAKAAGKYDPKGLTVLDDAYAEGMKYMAAGPIQPKQEEDVPRNDMALNDKEQIKPKAEPTPIKMKEERKSIEQESEPVIVSDIDINIPTSSTVNNNTFAVIIGNENYQRVAKVEFAENDANTFATYCKNALGIPANNIRSYTDATFGTMLVALKDIKSIADAYQGDLSVIFYYAGHGIPDGTGKAYLLPVDADGTQPEACLATDRLYEELNALQAKSVIVFMDACFSGAQRSEGMIVAARGVALKTKSGVPKGNCVVFSAANGEETAFPYKDKGHGMFTYFLLKKLQETKGNVTLGELGEYIQTNVERQSAVVNRKKQTPTVVPSASAGDWKSARLVQ